MIKFYGYNKCDTCRRAKKWLEAKGKKFEDIDVTLHPPSLGELKEFFQISQRPLKDFLNKSGEQYRALNMKEKIKTLPESEILKMLSQNGRLLKRPLVSDGKKITIGFDEKDFAKNWN